MKRLIAATPKTAWPSTMNLLLVCVGVRNAYYNDDDIPFATFSCKYQKAFLNVATMCNIGIQFEASGRWLIYNKNIQSPVTKSHAALGKLLQFPCSSGAMDIAIDTAQKVGVEFRIGIGSRSVLVTQFFCFKREISRIVTWFRKMRRGLSFLKGLGLFSTFEPVLIIEEYTLKGSVLTPRELRRMTLPL